MFPPVLTTEGAQAARPGSRDDPTRAIPVAPRNFARKGLAARDRSISPTWLGSRSDPSIASRRAHRSEKFKLSRCSPGVQVRGAGTIEGRHGQSRRRYLSRPSWNVRFQRSCRDRIAASSTWTDGHLPRFRQNWIGRFSKRGTWRTVDRGQQRLPSSNVVPLCPRLPHRAITFSLAATRVCDTRFTRFDELASLFFVGQERGVSLGA